MVVSVSVVKIYVFTIVIFIPSGPGGRAVLCDGA